MERSGEYANDKSTARPGERSLERSDETPGARRDDEPTVGEQIGEAVGGISGVLAGAAIGSAGGPLGTLVGGLAGALGGWWAGRAVSEAAERWTPEDEAERPRFSYFPFGGGVRRCIGEPFALMEAKVLLASIARRWRLRLDPAQRVEVLPRITLRPRYGMRMRLEARASR
jgi:hypothetical protein